MATPKLYEAACKGTHIPAVAPVVEPRPIAAPLPVSPVGVVGAVAPMF